MAQRCAVPTRQELTSLVRAPGCSSTAGAFRCSAPSHAERATGAERAPAQRERKGSERRKVFVQRNPEGGQLQLAELSERTLRGRLPVLRCCPFALFQSPAFLSAGRVTRRESKGGYRSAELRLHRHEWPGGRQPAGSKGFRRSKL